MAGIVDVVIDDRESDEFLQLFIDAGTETIRVERLRVGDFIVNQRWIFERKTIADLCASLVDGRLFRQALRMLKVPGYPVIILEGRSKECGSQTWISAKAKKKPTTVYTSGIAWYWPRHSS